MLLQKTDNWHKISLLDKSYNMYMSNLITKKFGGGLVYNIKKVLQYLLKLF